MQHTQITAQHNLLDLKLNEVWQYKDLVFLFAKRNFDVKYKQTILGPLWLFLNPLLTSAFDVILFGNIAKLSTDGVPQILFYLVGNAVWEFFSDRVNTNSKIFIQNAGLFGKVYFPRLTIPLADLLDGLLYFGIQMIVVLVLYVYFFFCGEICPPTAALLLLPLLLVQLGVLGLGTGIMISSLTTKYRDLAVLVSFGLQLWMYATPIVYPVSTLHGSLKTILLANPVTAPVELFRYALFGVGEICKWSILWSVICTTIVFFLGLVMFNRVERTFMDTV